MNKLNNLLIASGCIIILMILIFSFVITKALFCEVEKTYVILASIVTIICLLIFFFILSIKKEMIPEEIKIDNTLSKNFYKYLTNVSISTSNIKYDKLEKEEWELLDQNITNIEIQIEKIKQQIQQNKIKQQNKSLQGIE